MLTIRVAKLSDHPSYIDKNDLLVYTYYIHTSIFQFNNMYTVNHKFQSIIYVISEKFVTH